MPLLESRIGTLIVVGADVLGAGAVPDLMHLHGLDRIDRIVLIGRVDSDAYELFMAAGGRLGSADEVADIVSGYREPPIEVAPLAASYGGLHRTLIDQIVLLSRRIAATMEAFSRKQIRLAVLAAALQLLDRPRTPGGLVVRLHALDVALHARGYQLRPDAFADIVKQCQARTQLDLWLPDAIDPPLPRDGMIVEELLERPLSAGAETLATWLESFDDSRTREIYGKMVQPLLEWRERQQIDVCVHDAADLEDWVFDRLRAGDAPGSALLHRTAARRYYLYLLTGQHDPYITPSTYTRSRLRGLALPDDLSDLIRATPSRRVTAHLGLLSERAYRSPLESSQARRFLSQFQDDIEVAWQRIDALRLPDELWAKVDPALRRSDGASYSRRTRGYLNAILLVLETGMAWDAVPPELDYGSGGRAQRQLRAWVKDETWAAVRSELQDVDVYRDVRWERASRAPRRP